MIKSYYKKELETQGVLKLGAKGDDVEKVQEWLNLWRFIENRWYVKTTIDGDYGAQTQSSVAAYQQLFGLTCDGVVGLNTWNTLCSPLKDAYKKMDFLARATLSDKIVQYANQHLMNIPRELYNKNLGPWVRSYMDGNEGPIWAWCMGFVQTIIDQAFSDDHKKFTDIMPHSYSCDEVGNYGIQHERLIRNDKVKEDPKLVSPGDLFLKVKTEFDWVHTGIVTKINGDWIDTVEGNTNDEGAREGFEVCARSRNFVTSNIDFYKIIN